MYLLDTNTIIDFCNAKLPENGKQLLLSIEQPAISVISRIELFSSIKIPQREIILLEQFVQISKMYDTINIDIINQTISIRQKLKLKLPDAIIAATALAYNLTLITRNIADFKNIENLNLLNPYEM
jgi:predicted nucleic acid-binding protein